MTATASKASLFDEGLQPERTLLAWRRTCLLLAVGVAVGVRYGGALDPVASLWWGIPALALVAGAYAVSARRYTRVTRMLTVDSFAAIAGGTAISAVSCAAALIALSGLCFVFAGRLGA